MFHWRYHRKDGITSRRLPPHPTSPSFGSRATRQQLNSLTQTDWVNFTRFSLAVCDCISFLFCDYKPFVFPGVDKIFFLFFPPSACFQHFFYPLHWEVTGVLVKMQPNPEGISLLWWILPGFQTPSQPRLVNLGACHSDVLWDFSCGGTLFLGLCLPPIGLPSITRTWFLVSTRESVCGR